MKSGPDLDSRTARGLIDRARGADRAGRPVKSREEAIIVNQYLAPPVPRDLLLRVRLVPFKLCAPLRSDRVAGARINWADNPCGEHRRQHPIGSQGVPHASQKLFDLVKDGVLV